jgi:heterotetrameric sarcosine oxidase gamma subunit
VALTEGLARAAWQEGAATFFAHTPVTGIEAAGGRVRAVQTPAGRIEAEVVVCAAGLWGPLIGRMAGVNIPLTPCQHLYVRTNPLPELKGETVEVRHPVVRYQDKDAYYRQHGEAYGVGSYAHEPLLVPAEALPDNDHPAIFPFTPEHFESGWQAAVERFPAFAATGWADQFNGLFSFTPDGNSILGEAPHVRGFWAAEAVWVTHAGGVGRALAEWLVEGQPSLDLREVDVNRFHPHAASKPYVQARAERQYIEVYDIVHPLQQMATPRGLRRSPFHARLEALGAAFFEGGGWERPQWFEANAGLAEGQDWPRREGWAAQNWSPIIGGEHLATRERVGLFDLTAFAKLEVSGPGALAYLQWMTANQMDQPAGRVTYTSLLTARGTIKCDLTVTRLAPDRFWVVTGGGTGPMDLAWLRQHLPADGSAHIADVTSAYAAVGVWGPKARDLVQATSENDLSNEAFPYLTARSIYVGHAPALALRISYAGELGWEIYTPTEYGQYVWDTLWEAGQAHGAAAVGGGAFDSLRLEKGYRLWGAELHTEYNPYEAGLGFAVRLNKGDFLGRAALLAQGRANVRRRLVCLTLEDPGAALMGKEPILDGERVLGYVTSANYGYAAGESLAYGYLPVEMAVEGTRVEICSFGERHGARVAREPRWDAENVRLRA